MSRGYIRPRCPFTEGFQADTLKSTNFSNHLKNFFHLTRIHLHTSCMHRAHLGPWEARHLSRCQEGGEYSQPSGSLPVPRSSAPAMCDRVSVPLAWSSPGREPSSRDHRLCLAPRGTRDGLRWGAAFCIRLIAWVVSRAGAREHILQQFMGRPRKWVTRQSPEWARRWAPPPTSTKRLLPPTG